MGAVTATMDGGRRAASWQRRSRPRSSLRSRSPLRETPYNRLRCLPRQEARALHQAAPLPRLRPPQASRDAAAGFRSSRPAISARCARHPADGAGLRRAVPPTIARSVTACSADSMSTWPIIYDRLTTAHARLANTARMPAHVVLPAMGCGRLQALLPRVSRLEESHPPAFRRTAHEPLGSRRSHQANVPAMPSCQWTNRLVWSGTSRCRKRLVLIM